MHQCQAAPIRMALAPAHVAVDPKTGHVAAPGLISQSGMSARIINPLTLTVKPSAPIVQGLSLARSPGTHFIYDDEGSSLASSFCRLPPAHGKRFPQHSRAPSSSSRLIIRWAPKARGRVASFRWAASFVTRSRRH